MGIGYHSLWYFQYDLVKFAIGLTLLYTYRKCGNSAPACASFKVTLLKQNQLRFLSGFPSGLFFRNLNFETKNTDEEERRRRREHFRLEAAKYPQCMHH